MKHIFIIFCFFLISCSMKDNSGISDIPIVKTQWEIFFPQRWGYGSVWNESYTNLNIYYPSMKSDYYSYENFTQALKELRNIKLREIAKEGLITVYRMDTKKDKIWQEIYSYPGSGTFTNEIDFLHFANRPNTSKVDQNRELLAFLANISHEVGEGQGEDSYALFFREELIFERYPDWGTPGHFYQDASFTWFPPNPTPLIYPSGSKKEGQERFPVTSYHGRGPIQLSWNFNYGAFSAAILGDKNILLQDPDRILHDGKLGFMSAIWFWMMPQAPKPSIHQIMYKDSFKATHINSWGFGHSIVLINGFHEAGAIEGGTDAKDRTVSRRIMFYRRYANKLNIPIGQNGEQLDTQNMLPYSF
ncbi:MAG: chitinase [Brevinema sp.]